jgi:hypothetical protein
MQKWQLWSAGEPWRAIDDIEPVLDCWDKQTSKTQGKLQGYLDKLKKDLGPLPSAERKLFLHMNIVVHPEHYLRDHDLDNYLRPVVYALGATHFVFVSATKRMEGESQLLVGIAEPREELAEQPSWTHALIDAGRGSVAKKDWKIRIRETLLAQQQQQVMPEPVEVALLWRCSSRRNWTYLWKPTIDATGPVLGEPNDHNPFAPDEGRIVSLGLHFTRDDVEGWSVNIGMHWKHVPV